MLSKRSLAAALAIFGAIGLVVATGAFTTVTAERTATVSTAGDSSALLALQVVDSNYASETDGTIEINLDGADGEGVNLDALTQMDNVFNITNQGTQEVNVWITTNGTHGDAVTFYDDTHDQSSRSAIDSEANGYTLGTGDSVTVSMEIDTRDVSVGADEELINGIIVHANATGA